MKREQVKLFTFTTYVENITDSTKTLQIYKSLTKLQDRR